MNREKRDHGRWIGAACVGLLLSFLLPPVAAIAQEEAARAEPPPRPRLIIRKFPNACARCHKRDGRGGPSYGGYAADLRDTVLDHDDIVTVITDGRRDLGMPSFKGVLTTRKIDAIATFIEERYIGRTAEEE